MLEMNSGLLNKSNEIILPDCPSPTSSLYRLSIFTASHTYFFPAVIIATASRGHHLTTNINMGHNNAFSFSTYVVVYLMTIMSEFWWLAGMSTIYTILVLRASMLTFANYKWQIEFLLPSSDKFYGNPFNTFSEFSVRTANLNVMVVLEEKLSGHQSQ